VSVGKRCVGGVVGCVGVEGRGCCLSSLPCPLSPPSPPSHSFPLHSPLSPPPSLGGAVSANCNRARAVHLIVVCGERERSGCSVECGVCGWGVSQGADGAGDVFILSYFLLSLSPSHSPTIPASFSLACHLQICIAYPPYYFCFSYSTCSCLVRQYSTLLVMLSSSHVCMYMLFLPHFHLNGSELWPFTP
jgi:hypothetical protein